MGGERQTEGGRGKGVDRRRKTNRRGKREDRRREINGRGREKGAGGGRK